MSWAAIATIMSVGASALGVLWWGCRIFLQLGDASRARIKGAMDAAEKHKEEADAYVAPRRTKRSVLERMRQRSGK